MTQPGKIMDRPQEDVSLGKRISEVFNDRFTQLDRLQNAARVTQADLDFLAKTKEILADLDSRNTGNLEAGSAGFLENLLTMFGAANGQADRAELIEEGEQKKKGKNNTAHKEVEEEDTVTELTEKDFEGEEEPMAWFAAVRELEALVDAAEDADPAKQKSLLDHAVQAYNAFIAEEFDRNLSAINDAGATLADYPFLQVVSVRLNHIGDRLEALSELQVPETAEEPEESLESIWNRFNDEIRMMNGQINTLLDVSMEDAEGVALAREKFDVLIENMKGYADDWRADVGPILDGFKARKERWGNWAPLSKEHSALMLRFFGRKAKNEGDESIDGVLQQFGRALRDRSREVRKEVWENEFPSFALFAAKMIVLIQDALMRKGNERVEAIEEIQKSFIAMEEQWETLRISGPRIPWQERAKGVRSPVRQYDVLLRQLGKDIPMLLNAAPNAKPARLDDVAFLWSRALTMTEHLWNDGIDFRLKIAFLRRYGSGEADGAEIAKMIRADERENFELLAESDVLTDLRVRGVQKRERREQTERRERARLYHPKLEMLRMEAKDMYRDAINAPFWKDEITDKTREQLFAADATIDDEELKSLVTNGDAYRRRFGMVDSAYKRVAEVEDQLYIEGKLPEQKVKAKQLRRVIDRYLDAENKEVAAWKGAKNAPGWRVDHSKRDAVLHYEFNQFWNVGERAFADIPLSLRRPIVAWIIERLRLRTLETYTQWLIDENPVLAQSVENMPRVFAVPEKEVKEVGIDEDTEEEVVSDADKADLNLPVQEVRAGDETGGGAFDGLEGGAAAGLGRGSDEAGEVDDAGARVEALGEQGRTIVKALTE